MATTPKQTFLDHYDAEHATTMRVLRAYPEDKLDLKPAPKSNSARQLAWTFVMERYLGTKAWSDGYAKGIQPGSAPPKPPESWNELLEALEKAHQEFRALVESTPDEQLNEKIHFFTGPKTLGEYRRLDFAWFLLHDQIHHRGQFSVYLRIADGKVPSIYGPTADEPWT